MFNQNESDLEFIQIRHDQIMTFQKKFADQVECSSSKFLPLVMSMHLPFFFKDLTIRDINFPGFYFLTSIFVKFLKKMLIADLKKVNAIYFRDCSCWQIKARLNAKKK